MDMASGLKSSKLLSTGWIVVGCSIARCPNRRCPKRGCCVEYASVWVPRGNLDSGQMQELETVTSREIRGLGLMCSVF